MAKNTFNAEQFLADKDTSLAALGQRVQDYGSYLLSLQVGPLFDAHAAQLLTLAESAKAGFISEKDYDRFIQRTEQVLGGAKNILRFQAYDLFDPQALEIFDFMESKLPDYHRKPFYSGFAGLPLYEREIETYMNNTPRPPGACQEVHARPY